MQANNTLVPQNGNGSSSKGVLISKFADKFGVDQGQLADILKATCFQLPSKKNQPPQEVTNEQMAALLIVADQYGLNPFTKEIYAFPDKNKGIVPIVGVDGWTRIMNEHPQFDGMEFRYSDNIIQADEDAKPCPEWIEALIYRKDRSRPVIIREYLDECYKPAFKGQYGPVKGPWQSHTRRFLRHKVLIQGARVAFGFSGIYEEDEAERISEARVVNMNRDMPAAIDTQPVGKPKQQPVRQQIEKAHAADENSFFEGAEPAEEQVEDAEDIMGIDYMNLNAAQRKAFLNEEFKRVGVQLEKLEKLAGKSYAQWQKKERVILISALERLANGEDPVAILRSEQEAA